MNSLRIKINRFREIWQWGQRALVKDKGGGFFGNRAPIWRNPTPFMFFLSGLFGFIFFVTSLFILIFEISAYQECSFELKPIMISELCVVGFNVFIDMKFYFMKHASDVRWSRNLFYMFLQALMLLITSGVGFAGNYISFNNINGANCGQANPIETKMWRSSLSLNLCVGLLFLWKMAHLFFLTFKFYFSKVDLTAFYIMNPNLKRRGN